MLSTAAMVLAAVTSTVAASTWDQAACDPQADLAACTLPVEAPAPPPPVAPAVIDCHDPGMSVWVAEMIGSCDAPKTHPVTRPHAASIRAKRPQPLPQHPGSTLIGDRDASPATTASRSVDDDARAVLPARRIEPPRAGVPLALAHALPAGRVVTTRLERPPRA